MKRKLVTKRQLLTIASRPTQTVTKRYWDFHSPIAFRQSELFYLTRYKEGQPNEPMVTMDRRISVRPVPYTNLKIGDIVYLDLGEIIGFYVVENVTPSYLRTTGNVVHTSTGRWSGTETTFMHFHLFKGNARVVTVEYL
jgi:hypothetical protein